MIFKDNQEFDSHDLLRMVDQTTKGILKQDITIQLGQRSVPLEEYLANGDNFFSLYTYLTVDGVNIISRDQGLSRAARIVSWYAFLEDNFNHLLGLSYLPLLGRCIKLQNENKANGFLKEYYFVHPINRTLTPLSKDLEHVTSKFSQAGYKNLERLTELQSTLERVEAYYHINMPAKPDLLHKFSPNGIRALGKRKFVRDNTYLESRPVISELREELTSVAAQYRKSRMIKKDSSTKYPQSSSI